MKKLLLLVAFLVAASVVAIDDDDDDCFTLNFDTDGFGTNNKAGDQVGQPYLNLGITISSNESNTVLRYFDSSFATQTGACLTVDRDLGSPNAAFGGPGLPSNPATNNVLGQGLVMIKDELPVFDPNSCPNDDSKGNVIFFNFDASKNYTVVGASFLDLDDAQPSHYSVVHKDGSIETVEIASNNVDNNFVVADINKHSVKTFIVALWASGAIAEIALCNVPPPPPPPSICDTAFAFGPKTFIDYRLTTSRWGWVNTLTPGQSITQNIYAGAGQNDISKGTLVGTVNLSYIAGVVSVTVHLNSGVTASEMHIYASTSAPTTIAPGQFGHTYNFSPAATGDSIGTKTFNIGGSKAYVIVHLGTCV
jgi:hypothetical protein